MKLHLIRHASREERASSGNDFDCKLTALGYKQCKALAMHSKELITNVEVWCSGAKRTRQTISELANYIEFEKVIYYDEFHLCPKEIYLEKIWESPSANDLVIIGHNFGISRLVEYLTNEPLIMETAQLVSINFNELNRSEISAGTGVISYQYYPDPSSI